VASRGGGEHDVATTAQMSFGISATTTGILASSGPEHRACNRAAANEMRTLRVW